MFISRKKLAHSDRDDLIEIIELLNEKRKKKNDELARVREKLKHAKSRLLKMQSVISHQRKRIIELYPSANDNRDIGAKQ